MVHIRCEFDSAGRRLRLQVLPVKAFLTVGRINGGFMFFQAEYRSRSMRSSRGELAATSRFWPLGWPYEFLFGSGSIVPPRLTGGATISA